MNIGTYLSYPACIISKGNPNTCHPQDLKRHQVNPGLCFILCYGYRTISLFDMCQMFLTIINGWIFTAYILLGLLTPTGVLSIKLQYCHRGRFSESVSGSLGGGGSEKFESHFQKKTSPPLATIKIPTAYHSSLCSSMKEQP